MLEMQEQYLVKTGQVEGAPPFDLTNLLFYIIPYYPNKYNRPNPMIA